MKRQRRSEIRRHRGIGVQRRACAAAGMLVLMLVGCAASGQSAQRPQTPISVSIEPWTFQDRPGRSVITEHYVIRTTVADEAFVRRLALLMEGALQQYRQLTPGIGMSNRPMECFVFSRRREWVQFTREQTGPSAAVYLQINRGGYTVRDRFVAHFVGDVDTLAVAAHEGWHQYTGRHLRSRLPPFLEEGIATLFENISWDGDQPQWNLAEHPARARRLKHATDEDYLWPLGQLITMHAGEVVGLSGERIEAFYAQNWAFAQFLLSAEQGRYRPALQRLLTDAAEGTLYERDLVSAQTGWDPTTVRPMLERYLSMDLSQIEQAYLAYLHEVVKTVEPR